MTTITGEIKDFRITRAAAYKAIWYKFKLANIDPRPDRFALFVEDVCITSGLTSYQADQLIGYTQRLEERAILMMALFREFERDIPLGHSENIVKFFDAYNNLFKDKS